MSIPLLTFYYSTPQKREALSFMSQGDLNGKKKKGLFSPLYL
jgi:hypothetical protein